MFPSLAEVRKRRRLLNLSQKEHARLAGVSQSMVAKIEKERQNPSYEVVRRLFQALERQEHAAEKKVVDICTREVKYVEKHEPVSKVISLMEKYKISQLPVFDRGYPVGSISDKTFTALVLKGINMHEVLNWSVDKIKDEAFPTVDTSAHLDIVAKILERYNAVLVMKNEKVIGIVTKADLLKVAR